MIVHVSIYVLLMFTLSSFESEEGLPTKDERQFRNPTKNNTSKVKILVLRYQWIYLNSSTEGLVTHHLVNDAGRLIYGRWRADMYVVTTCLIAFVCMLWELLAFGLPAGNCMKRFASEKGVEALLYLYPGSHHFVLYPDFVNENTVHKVTMEEKPIFQTWASLPTATSTNGDVTLHDKYILCFKIDLIPEDVPLKQAIAFAYRNEIGMAAKD